MSNETDLDWLALNVHEWPTETDFVFVGTGISHGNMGWYPADYCFSKSSLVTKQQWLASRAELQNKPSWDAVPNHANWLTQDAAGTWLWHSSEPECRNGMWVHSTTKGYAAKGSVLGDWRDTLEKRPEQLKPSIDEANRLAQDFKPFISIEDNQEQEMKQDSGWFERGELPPVGSQCEVMHRGSWVVCGVIAHFQQKAAMVAAYTVDNGNAVKSLDSCIAKHFRPVRTERDVLLSVIVEEMNRYDTGGKLADAILAAGFSLRDK